MSTDEDRPVDLRRLLDRLDRATHRDLRLEQRLTDDLQLVENEGI